jgi:hypothetical protein
VGLRGHAGALPHLDKRAGERKCRPRDAGVETASLEELPSKKKSADQISLCKSHPVRAFWQTRSHDFNVFTQRKHVENPSSSK